MEFLLKILCRCHLLFFEFIKKRVNYPKKRVKLSGKRRKYLGKSKYGLRIGWEWVEHQKQRLKEIEKFFCELIRRKGGGKVSSDLALETTDRNFPLRHPLADARGPKFDFVEFSKMTHETKP
jgi:hypothetical protein